MDDELKNAIKQGSALKSIDPEEIKARELKKKKRMEELKTIEERLSKQES